MALAYGDVALLEATYAVLKDGLLALPAAGTRPLAFGVALAVTVAMAVGIAAYVYLRGGKYDRWNRWSLGAFVVGAVSGPVGTFVSIVLVGGFPFIFLGFTLRLGYEIWRGWAAYNPDLSPVHAPGVYPVVV